VPEPRFQLVTGMSRTPRPRVVRSLGDQRGPRQEPDLQVTWRLLGSNNREMGRSVTTYAALDECQEAVHHLKREVERLTSRLVTADPRGSWGWSLWLADEEVAVSARLFSRLREARSNVEQFLEKVPAAGITHLSTSASSMARRATPAMRRSTGLTKEAL
jgi:hypothetical protein